MNILIRLPNWLGDVVMSSAFVHACAIRYPESCIDVIVKKTHAPLLSAFHGVHTVYELDRRATASFARIWRFSRDIAARKRYDLFFSLPGSFSAALSGFLSGSRVRIGYRGDMRSFLLTQAYVKPASLHRVQEYLHLLDAYSRTVVSQNPVARLRIAALNDALNKLKTMLREVDFPRPWILFNPNSEAQSRRIPLEKAVAIADGILSSGAGTLILPGAKSDRPFTKSLKSALANPKRCMDMAGATDCFELAVFCLAADLTVTTDSGIAHLAAAVDRPVVVLFGAGDESNTAPFVGDNVHIIRAPGISCAPCVKNVCVHGWPRCLLNLDAPEITRKIRALCSE